MHHAIPRGHQLHSTLITIKNEQTNVHRKCAKKLGTNLQIQLLQKIDRNHNNAAIFTSYSNCNLKVHWITQKYLQFLFFLLKEKFIYSVLNIFTHSSNFLEYCTKIRSSNSVNFNLMIIFRSTKWINDSLDLLQLRKYLCCNNIARFSFSFVKFYGSAKVRYPPCCIPQENLTVRPLWKGSGKKDIFHHYLRQTHFCEAPLYGNIMCTLRMSLANQTLYIGPNISQGGWRGRKMASFLSLIILYLKLHLFKSRLLKCIGKNIFIKRLPSGHLMSEWLTNCKSYDTVIWYLKSDIYFDISEKVK